MTLPTSRRTSETMRLNSSGEIWSAPPIWSLLACSGVMAPSWLDLGEVVADQRPHGRRNRQGIERAQRFLSILARPVGVWGQGDVFATAATVGGALDLARFSARRKVDSSALPQRALRRVEDTRAFRRSVRVFVTAPTGPHARAALAATRSGTLLAAGSVSAPAASLTLTLTLTLPVALALALALTLALTFALTSTLPLTLTFALPLALALGAAILALIQALLGLLQGRADLSSGLLGGRLRMGTVDRSGRFLQALRR